MKLKCTIEHNGEEIDVFTFVKTKEGHLSVEATESAETLLVALEQVQDMIDYVRDELGE